RITLTQNVDQMTLILALTETPNTRQNMKTIGAVVIPVDMVEKRIGVWTEASMIGNRLTAGTIILAEVETMIGGMLTGEEMMTDVTVARMNLEVITMSEDLIMAVDMMILTGTETGITVVVETEMTALNHLNGTKED
ncbi:hypothetical protein HDU99_005764, partial [Rhizoclosmatium hyalinum]